MRRNGEDRRGIREGERRRDRENVYSRQKVLQRRTAVQQPNALNVAIETTSRLAVHHI